MYFQQSFNLASTQYIAQKMEIQGEPSIETLKQFRKKLSDDKKDIIQKSKMFQTKIVHSYDQVSECELYHLQKFCDNVYYIDEDTDINQNKIYKQMLKFFAPQYDLTLTQNKALNIFLYTLPPKKSLQYHELQIVYRVIGISYLSNHQYSNALNIMGKILDQIKTDPKPTHLIRTITDFHAIDILKKYLDHVNWDDQDLLMLTIIDYLDTLIIQCQKQKIQILDLSCKFIQFIFIMTNMLPYSLDYHQHLFYGISKLNQKIPCFRFPIKQLYLEQNCFLKFQSQIQIETAKQLYKKDLLVHIINFRSISNWQMNNIFGVISLILRQIKLQQFQSLIMPLVINYYETQTTQLTFGSSKLSLMLLKFIHLNKQLLNSHYLFMDIFCKTKMFQSIMNQINNKCKRICFNQYCMNQQEKKSYFKCEYGQQDLQLFYSSVLAFQIIRQCKILTFPICQIHATLKRASYLVDERYKNEWPAHVINKLFTEFQEQQNQHGQDYFTSRSQLHYQTEYQI